MKNDFNSNPGTDEASLADLAPGTEAVVLGVDSSSATGRRLLDLGLLPRTRVRALRRAPLGDPSLYELRGYQLCLRRADACHVRVHVESSDPATRGPASRP